MILDYWGESFLAYYQLADLVGENCWLKNIFRKHRKAFSYIEHLLVLKALVPEQIRLKHIGNILKLLQRV